MVQGKVELETCLMRSYRFALQFSSSIAGSGGDAHTRASPRVYAESHSASPLTVTHAHAMVDRYALDRGSGVCFTPACASHACLLEYRRTVSPNRQRTPRVLHTNETATTDHGVSSRIASPALRVLSCIVFHERRRYGALQRNDKEESYSEYEQEQEEVEEGVEYEKGRSAATRNSSSSPLVYPVERHVSTGTPASARAMRCVLQLEINPALAEVHSAGVWMRWPGRAVEIVSTRTVPDGLGTVMVYPPSETHDETRCVWDLGEVLSTHHRRAHTLVSHEAPQQKRQRQQSQQSKGWLSRFGMKHVPQTALSLLSSKVGDTASDAAVRGGQSKDVEESGTSSSAERHEQENHDTHETTVDRRDGAPWMCHVEVVYRLVTPPPAAPLARVTNVKKERLACTHVRSDNDDVAACATHSDVEEDDELARPHDSHGTRARGAFAHVAVSAHTAALPPPAASSSSSRARKRRERVRRQGEQATRVLARRTHTSPALWWSDDGGGGGGEFGANEREAADTAEVPRVILSYRVGHLVSGLTIRRLRVVKESANWSVEEGGRLSRHVWSKLVPCLTRRPLTRLAHYTTYIIQPIAVTKT